jgi:hypothetical protein
MLTVHSAYKIQLEFMLGVILMYMNIPYCNILLEAEELIFMIVYFYALNIKLTFTLALMFRHEPNSKHRSRSYSKLYFHLNILPSYSQYGWHIIHTQMLSPYAG